MPRFVLLWHATPAGYGRASHWDLMFERRGALRTWALPQLPPADASPIVVESLADHRLAYLDYEGPVAGDRGEVRREDRGEYELILESPDEFVAELQGELLSGRLRLVKENAAWICLRS